MRQPVLTRRRCRPPPAVLIPTYLNPFRAVSAGATIIGCRAGLRCHTLTLFDVEVIEGSDPLAAIDDILGGPNGAMFRDTVRYVEPRLMS